MRCGSNSGVATNRAGGNVPSRAGGLRDWLAGSAGPTESRYHSNLLEKLLLWIVAGGLVAVVSWAVIDPTTSLQFNRATVLPLAVLLALAVVGCVNRVGHYRLAATLTVVILSGATFGGTLLSGNPQNAWMLSYLVLPVIVGSMFLNKRLLAGLVLVNFAGLVLVACVPSGGEVSWAPLLLFALASVLVLVAKRHSETLEDLGRSEIAQSEGRYRSLVESASDAVWRIDPMGRMAFVSPAAERLTGYTPEELVGRPFAMLLDEESAGRAQASIQEWLGGAPPRDQGGSVELIHRRKDGGTFVGEVRSTPIYGPKGDLVEVQGITRDITDRKRAQEEQAELEEQLRQSQKMEAVGQLAGGVAHDFNNILQAVFAHLDFALDGLSPGDERYEELMGIARGAEKGSALTRQLLAFSRGQILRPKDLDVNDLVGDLLKMIRRLIGEDIDLDFIAGHNVGHVHADPGQIEQVLMNLCVNARDAMPEGGTIAIETRGVVLDRGYCEVHSWAQEGRFVVLSVSDSGSGMNEETRQRVFEPFFTTKEVGKGTGLGLATVYGIVRQHDGMVTVYSEVGEGTVFGVYLPRVEAAGDEDEAAEEPTAPGGSETILVAEDDEMVRALAARVLEKAGYRVLLAANGAQAVQQFHDHADEIALALLDVVMPEQGGREVYDQLRQTHPDVRVLFSSGYSADTIHRRFVLDEGMELIQKPYDPRALLRRIRETIDA